MFPISHYPDTSPLETLARLLVTLSISRDLQLPKPTVCLRKVSASGAAVPEAPVHKDRKPVITEVEIRPPRQIVSVQGPSADSGPHKCHTKCRLSCLVAFSTDRRHNSGTLRCNVSKAAVAQLHPEEPFHSGKGDARKGIAICGEFAAILKTVYLVLLWRARP